MNEFVGTYDLESLVPDGLSQKQLTIFEDGKIVLLEFEGSMAGAYQDYYIGSFSSQDAKIRIHFFEYRGYSNFLVDDALTDEERTSISKREEIIEGSATWGEDLRLSFPRAGFNYQYKRVSTRTFITNEWVLRI